MTSVIYHSHSTTKGTANFKTIPFNNASIEFNSAKASTANFNSIQKLNEGDRIRIIGNNHRPFGGQIIKPGSKLKDGAYSYECVDYTRLFFGKSYTTWSGGTSDGIIKAILNSLNYSTAGIEKTKAVHGQLIWKNVVRWDIIQQLRWLDYKAGQLIECYVNADGILIYRPLPQTQEGYIFKSAYDYSQEYDASNIITGATVLTKEGDTISNVQNDNLVAVWGQIFDREEGC
ncbi:MULTISPECIES: XkdQ/YqbQ family protein [Methanobacterium]|uniref:YqbQ/XkdQ domain-containing protein n=1 Tax=Methanobacterium bryantii TaxID=2161 RepID=A0A2A2H915_METBR|nr:MULTISPECIES: hypothetical protein [Methanobacterium]OEC87897.1 hypothetical protein A9507_06895 [Methanobacterium sp. A39]PAV05764.1 hypothetical protein ASJ80_08505 [Methanobacterium bryantii]